MMKGLFNYKTAYEEYTKQLLQDFVDESRLGMLQEQQASHSKARTLLLNICQCIAHSNVPIEPYYLVRSCRKP